MLGSVFISARLSDGPIINIKHIFIEGSLQWVVGRNVTSKFDIVHSNGNYLKLPNNLRIPIKDFHMHLFLPSHLFLADAPNSSSSFQAKIFVPLLVSKKRTLIVLGPISRKPFIRSTNMCAVMQN